MRAIIPEQEKNPYVMNRAQKRKMMQDYNRKHDEPITREMFDQFLLMQRLKNGMLTDDDVHTMAQSGMAHLDNEEKFPNGTPVKLNYENIMKRNKDDLTEKFVAWVEDNKDREFHLAREENKQSLVCLEEDERFEEVDGEVKACPKWLFDMYSDLLVMNDNGEWVDPFSVGAADDEYVDITEKAEEALENSKKE